MIYLYCLDDSLTSEDRRTNKMASKAVLGTMIIYISAKTQSGWTFGVSLLSKKNEF